jgi:2,3-dihydroxyphenylpropionate 1,2-dioxygenase
VSTVFIGVCSHGPGITGRSERAEPRVRDAFYAHFARMREAIEAERPDALVIVAAEHFANFFMNNMPASRWAWRSTTTGPIEDEKWLAIPRTRIQGNAQLSRRLIASMLREVDLATRKSGSSITASWCRCIS